MNMYVHELTRAQMVGDEERGWAWTRALLGIPAKEVHICGDITALQLVKNMTKATGDRLTVCYCDCLW